MVITLIVVGIFIVLAGIFDGAQTSRKDLGLDSPIYDWLKSDKLKDWYIGGNEKYNPSFPSIPFFGIYYADFWHTMKHGWILSYACAIATLVCSMFTGYYAVLAWVLTCWLAWGIEGDTFRIFYGNVFRKEPKQTIMKILSDINPFVNTHKGK